MPKDLQLLDQLTPKRRYQRLDRTMLLEAIHPQHGRVGKIEYSRQGRQIHLVLIAVDLEFRRRGVAGWLMTQLEAAYPGASIHHGDRTKAGVKWYQAFYGHLDPVTQSPRR